MWKDFQPVVRGFNRRILTLVLFWMLLYCDILKHTFYKNSGRERERERDRQRQVSAVQLQLSVQRRRSNSAWGNMNSLSCSFARQIFEYLYPVTVLFTSPHHVTSSHAYINRPEYTNFSVPISVIVSVLCPRDSSCLLGYTVLSLHSLAKVHSKVSYAR